MDTDQRTIEVEPVDTADALAKSFRAVIDEGVKLADSLGKAVVTAFLTALPHKPSSRCHFSAESAT